MIRVAELKNGNFMVVNTFLGIPHCAYDSNGLSWHSKEYRIAYCQFSSKEDAFALAHRLDIKIGTKIARWVKE